MKKGNDNGLIIAGLVTAESPCGFNAMKAFVKTVDRKRETCEGETHEGETREGETRTCEGET